MLSLFSGTESERERLVRAGQSLLDSLQGCILATGALLCILTQHLDTSVSLEPVGGDVGVGENLECLLRAAQEMHATAEQTDRHVRKNTSRDLYAHMASPHTSLLEKGAIVWDFHQATLGIFGSVGGPVVAVLLRNAGLPERLEAALREAEASPVLRLPMDALRRSSEEIARAVSACVAPGGPAGERLQGPPRTAPSPGPVWCRAWATTCSMPSWGAGLGTPWQRPPGTWRRRSGLWHRPASLSSWRLLRLRSPWP
ncbi:unnamed protein product [Natator depressus]